MIPFRPRLTKMTSPGFIRFANCQAGKNVVGLPTVVRVESRASVFSSSLLAHARTNHRGHHSSSAMTPRSNSSHMQAYGRACRANSARSAIVTKSSRLHYCLLENHNTVLAICRHITPALPTQVIGDTITFLNRQQSAGHALARPGHYLVRILLHSRSPPTHPSRTT